MSKRTRKKVRNIVFSILSFVLALFLFIDIICVFTAVFAINENRWIDQMNASNYFSDKADEITNRLVALGNASGLPPEFFDEAVDPIQITNDTQTYMDSYFSGKSEVVYSSGFKQKFYSELDSYIAENNLKVDDANIDYLVNNAERIYLGSLEIPLLSRLSDYIVSLRSVLPFIIAGLSMLSAAIILIMFFGNKWKHRTFKYYYYASAGTCLSLFAVSVFLSCTGGLKNIILESRALYYMAVSFGASVTMALWALTAFFFIVSFTLFLVYSNKIKKVTSTD